MQDTPVSLAHAHADCERLRAVHDREAYGDDGPLMALPNASRDLLAQWQAEARQQHAARETRRWKPSQ